MNRARAACTDAASVLRPGHLQFFPQHPKKWRGWIDAHLLALPVYVELIRCHHRPPILLFDLLADRECRLLPTCEWLRQIRRAKLAARTATCRRVDDQDSTPTRRAAPLDCVSTTLDHPYHCSSIDRRGSDIHPRSIIAGRSCPATASKAAPGASCVHRELQCCRRWFPDDNSHNLIRERPCRPDRERRLRSDDADRLPAVDN